MSRHRVHLQIDATHAARLDLLQQKIDIQTRTAEQSQDQSAIYQYLRKKLQDNYVAIAELETKVRDYAFSAPTV